jgi:hypothetical protein
MCVSSSMIAMMQVALRLPFNRPAAIVGRQAEFDFGVISRHGNVRTGLAASRDRHRERPMSDSHPVWRQLLHSR